MKVREKSPDRDVVYLFPPRLRSQVFGKTPELVVVRPQRMRGRIALSAQRIQKLADALLYLRARLCLSFFHGLPTELPLLPRG
jgi:hypothetical protein